VRDDQDFPYDREALCGAVAELCAFRGQAREVALLTFADVDVNQEGYDNWNGGTYEWSLTLRVPSSLYVQFEKGDLEEAQKVLTDTLLEVEKNDNHHKSIVVAVTLKPRPDWRQLSLQWLRGEGINNQGRVRSDNVAARQDDGLLFRSQPEIFMYRAFKELGVTFAPLPVFLRGGPNYQRIEPDFVLFKSKHLMIIEVDGDTVHRETPAEADKRTRLFKYEGAFVEHVAASECDTQEKAMACAKRLLTSFQQLLSNR
jgi:hypothetical protein